MSMPAPDAVPDAVEPEQVAIGKVDEAGGGAEASKEPDGKDDYERQVLTWQVVNDSYMFTAKFLLILFVLLLIFCVPFWLLPRFSNPGSTWTAEEFKKECLQDQDNALEDEAGAFFYFAVRRFIVNFGLVAVICCVRCEYLREEREPGEMRRVSCIRWCYIIPAGIIRVVKFMIECSAGSVSPDIRNTNVKAYQLLLLMNFGSALIGSWAFIQSSNGLNEPWFTSRCISYLVNAAYVFCTVLCIVVGTFGKTILANENQQAAFIGQIVLIVLANVLELVCKQLFVRTKMDPGLMGVYSWSVTNSFKLAIRVFAFVRPDLPSVITAILISFGTQVLGQIFNYLKWTFILRGGPPPKVQAINNIMFLHELTASHACNFIVLIMLFTSDPRYWMITTSVGVDGAYDLKLIGVAFVIAELFEFFHDAVMFCLVYKSQPRVDIASAAKSSRALKVMLPYALVSITIGAIVATELRVTCLWCGAAIPTTECYVDLSNATLTR